MATPQAGISTECTNFHYYEKYGVLAGKNTANALVAFGGGLWQKLSYSAQEALGNFTAIESMHSLESIAAQHDFLLWSRAASHAHVLDADLNSQWVLNGNNDQKFNPPGYVYCDSCDLTGFVGGSSNSKEGTHFAGAFAPDDGIGTGGALS
jgi:hypothetical protein